MIKPLPEVTENTWEFLRDPMIAATGFREYDARWKFPGEINLPGLTALGLGLGTQMHANGIEPIIAVANDYRDYSLSVKNALIGGGYEFVDGVRQAYLDDLVGDFRMTRKLKIVCATGNGTASAFAPELLRRIGVEVVASHNRLDYRFPHYNPNPEAMEMLHDMSASVSASGADLALGFDGDGDRCGVVDNEGQEIFADKVGVILARDLARLYPGSTFVADVKSFMPELACINTGPRPITGKPAIAT